SIHAPTDSKQPVQSNYVSPLPGYIVYFSSAALLDGSIVDYKDLYGRDSLALAALQMKDGGASLAPPKPKPTDQIAGGAVKAKTAAQDPLAPLQRTPNAKTAAIPTDQVATR